MTRNNFSKRLSKTLAWRGWDWMIWSVIVLTIVGGFFRFYKLSNTVMFLGDQGRDAIVVSRIFTHLDPVFLGPVTSVGNMYLGPAYYYFMLPFLRLSYPNPMGPVYAIALLGTLLIPLTFLLGSRMIGRRAAFLASIFVTFSSSAIGLSRFSWNPNPMPLVGLIWFYCLYSAASGKRWYWIGVAITLAILLQLHYITFLAVAASGLVWLGMLVKQRRNSQWKQLIVPSVIALVIVLLFQLPLVLFDARHDWLNARQFVKLLHGKDAFANDRTGIERLSQIMYTSQARLIQLMVRITFEIQSKNELYASFALLLSGVVFWMREKRSSVKLAAQLLLLAILVSLIGLSVYKNDVYLHYLGFLLPLVFLLFGYVFDSLIRLHKIFVVVVIGVMATFVWLNVRVLSFQGGGPRLPMLAATAEAIHERVSEGEPYTIMLISESFDLYGMNYRYFLTTNPRKEPLNPEHFGEAKKMFVLWENKAVLEPLKLPLYELQVFDVATPSATFDIPDGPTVLELSKE